MDAILTFLLEKWPVLVVVVILTPLVWGLSKLHSRFIHVEEHAKNAPCNSHVNDIAELKRERVNIADMSADLNTIAKWVMKFDPTTIESLAKGSPYRILPHGYALLELSQGKKCVDGNFDFFKKYINERKPETKYDVENIATLSASACMSQSFMNPVKDFLYSAPEKMNIKAVDNAGNLIEKEMSISTLLINQLVGIYVRDKYLALFNDGRKEHFYVE